MSGNAISILIVEDNLLLRGALRSLISAKPGLFVAGEAGDGREAVERYNAMVPDVVIMDLSLPGLTGEEAIRRIKRDHPTARILVLTVHPDAEHVYLALDAGADGYIPKDASPEELFMAIESVARGMAFISPQVARFVVQGYLLAGRGELAAPELDELTERELQVFKLVADGYRNKQVAEALFISIKTVEKHRSNIMAKLDLKKGQLAAFAKKTAPLLAR